ncbi:MAG TPA: hypothetical protein VGH80_00450 [Xanthomonadaceae bacterium]|jgi:hypothetical protein
MIRRLMCCTLLCLAIQAAVAQDRMPPRGPPMDEIAAAVGLKDSQRAPVEKILEQHHAAMMALHEAMRGKQDALEKQARDSLARVLTPEQLARFEQWHATHRPPPPGGFGGRGPQVGQGMGGPGGNAPGGIGPGGNGGGPGMGMRGGPGMGGPGGYGPDNQGRRPPPPGGQGGQDMPPPPPSDDGDRPPPPGGGGYGQPAQNGG